MLTGRKFAARFKNSSAREAYLTWSAGQMFIYNECVLEQRFFDSLSRLIGETERHKQPIRNVCRVARPKPDQKYAHFVDKAQRPWLSQVPSAILGIGAFRFCQASKRAAAGLAARPKLRAIKDAERHLLLTRAYFTIKPTSRAGWYELRFGSARIPGGTILFRAHREFAVPAMVSVTLTSKALFVSMSYEETEQERFPETEKEMLERLRQYSEEELIACGNGIDRGVVRPVQTSNEPVPYALQKISSKGSVAKNVSASIIRSAWLVAKKAAVTGQKCVEKWHGRLTIARMSSTTLRIRPLTPWSVTTKYSFLCLRT